MQADPWTLRYFVYTALDMPCLNTVLVDKVYSLYYRVSRIQQVFGNYGAIDLANVCS